MTRFYLFFYGLLGLSWQVGCGETNKYDNYTLMHLYPTNDDQIVEITKFKDPEGEIEVLKSSRGYNDSTDVLVPSNRMDFMQRFVDEMHVKAEVKMVNYGRLFESMTDRIPRRRKLNEFSVFEFNSYPAILQYTENLASRYPNLVTLEDLGHSYEGRQMKLVKISSNPRRENPIIMIDAGIHAREWVAPAMAIYIMHRLTHDPEAINNELNGVDWYIIPVVNPDGYEYTRARSSNRMWRKTRSKNNEFNCYGVDGNRNYGFKWAVSGVSNNPCDLETYAGPVPFSEPETQMVKKVMMDNAERIKLYVSIHSYGQYLVYPWGYTGSVLPKQWKKLDNLARAVSNAVVKAGGPPFKVLSAGKWYPAAGGSDDYAFGAIGVPYSYTMELTEGYEFVFPAYLLHKVLPQFYDGFKVFSAQIKSEFGNSRRQKTAEKKQVTVLRD